MTKLNLAATEIMGVSSLTRTQSRQMLLQVQDENKCTIEIALYAIMRQLERVKQAGVKGRANGEELEDKVIKEKVN